MSSPLTPIATAQLHSKTLAGGLVLATVGAIGFSGKAIIVKLAYRHGVDAVTLIMLRMLLALPLFAVMAWWAGRGKAALTRRDWLGVFGLGFSGYYLASFLDFAGLAYISASLERLILYLNPTLVLFFGWVLYRRRATRVQVLGMAISYVGVMAVFGHELWLVQGAQAGKAGAAAWGALLCFLSAISYAGYLVYSGEFVKRLGSLRLVGLASSVACVLCIVQFLVLRPLDAALTVAPEVIWLSVLNATLCTAMPVLLVMMAVERLGAAATAPDRHDRADVDHPDGCRDTRRALHRMDRGRQRAGDCRYLRIHPIGTLRSFTWTLELQARRRWCAARARGWASAARWHWCKRA